MSENAEKLLEILAEVLSFDRPMSQPQMVTETRDFMAAWGYPVWGDPRRMDCAQATCRRRWQHRPLPAEGAE